MNQNQRKIKIRIRERDWSKTVCKVPESDKNQNEGKSRIKKENGQNRNKVAEPGKDKNQNEGKIRRRETDWSKTE